MWALWLAITYILFYSILFIYAWFTVSLITGKFHYSVLHIRPIHVSLKKLSTWMAVLKIQMWGETGTTLYSGILVKTVRCFIHYISANISGLDKLSLDTRPMHWILFICLYNSKTNAVNQWHCTWRIKT